MARRALAAARRGAAAERAWLGHDDRARGGDGVDHTLPDADFHRSSVATSVEEAGNGAGIDNGAGTDDRVASDSKVTHYGRVSTKY